MSSTVRNHRKRKVARETKRGFIGFTPRPRRSSSSLRSALHRSLSESRGIHVDRKTAQKFECQCAGRTDELLRCEQSIVASSIIVPSLLIARQLQHRVRRGHRRIAPAQQLNYTENVGDGKLPSRVRERVCAFMYKLIKKTRINGEFHDPPSDALAISQFNDDVTGKRRGTFVHSLMRYQLLPINAT